jgi:uroporphyrinogen III methyltransferase / synthase
MGTVYLVGAGPGDPGLLTLRGARLLETADVVVYDEAVGTSVMRACPEGVERERAGEGPGRSGVARLVELAGRAERVVRLYAGDPFVPGRGAADASALVAAGVPIEVVPGVVAPLSAAVCAGLPLGAAGGSVSIVSGRGVIEGDSPLLPGKQEMLLVDVQQEEIAAVVERLSTEAGGERLFATLVTDGAGPRQQVVSRPLDQLRGEGADWSGPGVLIVGRSDVEAQRLTWFEQRPLFGRKVVVTRPRAQAGDFVSRLEELGAEVIPFATIRITDPPDVERLRAAVHQADSFSWIVFTSVNGVHRFWEELRASGRDTRVLAGVSLCAIGPATAAAIELEGASADLVPEEHVAEAVVAALEEQAELQGARILLPRAAEARSVLPESLRARGAEVLDVAAYSTVPDAREAAGIRRMLDSGEIDLVTFTASSTVRNFVAAVGHRLGGARVASIGPITSETARELGLEVAVEATEYTVPGLTEAIVSFYGGGGR